MINEIIMQLVEEETNPDELFLEDIAEEALELEDDTISGLVDIEDELIERINAGLRIGCDDAIDFTDAEINDAVFDDLINDYDE